jgi:hypothetical protein
MITWLILFIIFNIIISFLIFNFYDRVLFNKETRQRIRKEQRLARYYSGHKA